MTTNLPSGAKRRPKRTERIPAASLPGFRLTQRDEQIIRAVYGYRALTTDQIAALFFPASTLHSPATPGRNFPVPNSRCLARLRYLFHASFLHRFEQPQTLTEGRKPLVYVLGEC